MSMPRVAVVDYGMGNVLSVCRALERCGAEPRLTGNPRDVASADRLILPGVGAFGDCVAALRQRSLVEAVRSFIDTSRPFLGICVGMQILLDFGEEFGVCEGLGLIGGRVVMIPTESQDGSRRKIPHIGWAETRPPSTNADRWRDSVLAETPAGESFYFVHSFTAMPSNDDDLLAVADYQGVQVTAALQRDNIIGTQFHPEKSGPAGLALIGKFIAM